MSKNENVGRKHQYCLNCGYPLEPKQVKYCCVKCRNEYQSFQQEQAPSPKKSTSCFDAYFRAIKEGPYISYGEWMAQRYLGRRN